jgi:hypothetical protein
MSVAVYAIMLMALYVNLTQMGPDHERQVLDNIHNSQGHLVKIGENP